MLRLANGQMMMMMMMIIITCYSNVAISFPASQM